MNPNVDEYDIESGGENEEGEYSNCEDSDVKSVSLGSEDSYTEYEDSSDTESVSLGSEDTYSDYDESEESFSDFVDDSADYGEKEDGNRKSSEFNDSDCDDDDQRSVDFSMDTHGGQHSDTFQGGSLDDITEDGGGLNNDIRLIRKDAAFQNRISEYILKNIHHIDPKKFLNDASNIFKTETKTLLAEHMMIKIHTSLKLHFRKTVMSSDGDFVEEKMDRYFNTKSTKVEETTNLDEFFSVIIEKTLQKVNDFQLHGSGWALSGIDGLMVVNCKYECFNGSSYMKTPQYIWNKKAVINIKNKDNKCFLWSVLAALHHDEIKQNLERVSHYRQFEHELDMNKITFPVSVDQIDRFEMQNSDISINVYAYKQQTKTAKEKATYFIYPIRLTKNVRNMHIHLLLMSEVCDSDDIVSGGDDYNDTEAFYYSKQNIVDELESCEVVKHYCFIKDLSKLLQSQLYVKNRRRKYYCDRCLNYFYTLEKKQIHSKTCFLMNNTKITLPSEDEKIIEFKNHGKKLPVPIVIYADTEAFLKPILQCEDGDDDTSLKGAYQRHIPHSIAYYLHSLYPSITTSRYEQYCKTSDDSDCITWFVKQLKTIGEEIYPILNTNKKMHPLTAVEEDSYQKAEFCHICDEKFNEQETQIRVRDHSHLTGNFRGAAHSSCNLKFQEPRMIPVVFHNLKYDLHLIIEKMASVAKGSINIIPTSTENYLSFTKYFECQEMSQQPNHQYNYKHRFSFRFIDSFRFLPESLETLASNLSESELKISRGNWKDISDEQFKLIQRKGVYPYDYVKSSDNLNETSLPPKEDFYNILNDTHISMEEYQFAQTVWSAFNVVNIQQYTNIYLKTDVLLLADIFENFRETSMIAYGLDPAHYFTLPGYSWDAMLKFTKAKIELIHGTNIDQINFVEQGK